MRAVIQRVSEASVTIHGKVKAKIGKGLLIFLGIEEADSKEDIEWLVGKIIKMKIFPDESEVMNKSLLDTEGEALIVSQFTLHASTKKGNRPSYIKAAKPNISVPLYEAFISVFENRFGKKIETGEFGADMQVALINDGPITLLIDSKNKA